MPGREPCRSDCCFRWSDERICRYQFSLIDQIFCGARSGRWRPVIAAFFLKATPRRLAVLAEVFVVGGLLLVHLPAAPVIVTGDRRLRVVGSLARVDLVDYDCIAMAVLFKNLLYEDIARKVPSGPHFLNFNLAVELWVPSSHSTMEWSPQALSIHFFPSATKAPQPAFPTSSLGLYLVIL